MLCELKFILRFLLRPTARNCAYFLFCFCYIHRDPQGVVEIVGALYSDKYFYPSIANALFEDGIFISQVRVQIL